MLLFSNFKIILYTLVAQAALILAQSSDSNETPTPTATVTRTSTDSVPSEAPPQIASIPFLSVTTPVNIAPILFELGSTVELGWKIQINFADVDGSVSIFGSMPEGRSEYIDPSTRKPYTWDIATNITANSTTWDTRTQTPPGISLPALTGYKMIFYDAKYGRNNFSSFYTPLTFALYNSEYNRTNEGVPDNYDSSTATPNKPPALAYLLIAITTALTSLICL